MHCSGLVNKDAFGGMQVGSSSNPAIVLFQRLVAGDFLQDLVGVCVALGLDSLCSPHRSSVIPVGRTVSLSRQVFQINIGSWIGRGGK
ncbi:hypothetical protein BJX61DRAFT_507992 [Aspergillus egyptiacus]|nr:hypothetical protein BJX61DRAFT_507992 [Aspergillus egyptiacus]